MLESLFIKLLAFDVFLWNLRNFFSKFFFQTIQLFEFYNINFDFVIQ